MSKQLFIGGPADGERFDLDANCYTVTIPVLPKLKCVFDDGAPRPTTFNEVQYERMEFSGGRASYFIYAPVGMTGDEVLLYLIKGYKR